MAGFFSSEGERRILASYFDQQVSDIYIGLYQNDLTPDGETVWGDLVEATFSGYARVNPASWTDSHDAEPSPGELVPDGEVVFTHNGGATDNDIYGMFVIHFAGGPITLLYSERFPVVPLAIENLGDNIELDVTLRLRDAAEA